MKNFLENCKIGSWIAIGGFLINLQLQSIGFTMFLALLYVITQTGRLVTEPKMETIHWIWYLLSVVFGFVTCTCLATAIGLDCLSTGGGGGIMPHISIINVFLFIGILFPIAYFLFINILLKIKNYSIRGILLLLWVLVATFYFKQAANRPIRYDEFGCPNPSPMPIMNIIIPLIVFLYGMYLLQLKNRSPTLGLEKRE
ncbi:MAG: hypothetical protein RLZZ628_2318 [Bacteroidota bacterium]|jgi:hypothetical protein